MSTSNPSNPFPPNVWLFPDAVKDIEALDGSLRVLVFAALRKIARQPSHFGKDLGNQEGRHLVGFRSTYVGRKSLRIVWRVVEQDRIEVAVVAAVAERNDYLVYRVAARRRADLDAWLAAELKKRQGQPPIGR